MKGREGCLIRAYGSRIRKATEGIGSDDLRPCTDLSRLYENSQLTVSDELIENCLDANQPGNLLTVFPVHSHHKAERDEDFPQNKIERESTDSNQIPEEGDHAVEESHECNEGHHNGRDVDHQQPCRGRSLGGGVQHIGLLRLLDGDVVRLGLGFLCFRVEKFSKGESSWGRHD